MCLSARCVLVCCCTVGTGAQLHLAGAAVPTPVHGHTGSIGPLHRVCCAALSVLCGRCHTAWCCALHCTVCALPHCTCGQWAVEAPLCTALLPVGRGQWNSCSCPPHCLGAVGSGTAAMHCLTAWGQWAVELLKCTATLPVGSGRWNCYNALPHCLGAVGKGTPVMHRHTAWGQWAVELMLCTATLPGGSGQWKSCNAPPHCLGAVAGGGCGSHFFFAFSAFFFAFSGPAPECNVQEQTF